jgi:urease accessory protein
VIAPVVEPAMDLLRALRAVWRSTLWGVAPLSPRIWST